MKEINKRKLDNMKVKLTTFPISDKPIVIVTCTNIKTRMVWTVWNNEEPLNFATVR
jgi:hypothetical protein